MGETATIINPLAVDSAKIILPISDFIVVSRDDLGRPIILLSKDLKSICVRSGNFAIPISGPMLGFIITFDASNQNISNGALVPPENKLTAFNDNAVRTQILSNKGHIISTTAAQNGWFMSVDDLLAVGNGSTWKKRWVMDFATGDAGTFWAVPYILDADVTVAAAAGFRSEGLVLIDISTNGKQVVFRYQDTSNVWQNIKVVSAGNDPEGTSVQCFIERTATKFKMTFDELGATIGGREDAEILISLVKAHTVNKFMFGDAVNNAFFGTLNIDDITYPNAS